MLNNKKTALPPDKTLLTRLEASYYLDISPNYLRSLCLKGVGPNFLQPSGKWGKIMFHIDHLDDWIKKNIKKNGQ